MRLIPAMLVAAAFAIPAAARAQVPSPAPVRLQSGQWTGTVTTPNGEVSSVTYDVATVHDTTTMVISAQEHGTFKVADLKYDGTTLLFSFTPGPQVTCTLKKQDDGSLSGQCVDNDSGGVATMVMTPPKKPDSK